MSEITQQPTNPKRYHAVLTVESSDLTDFTDLAAAGLVILAGGVPVEAPNHPAVEIYNDGEDGVDPTVYLYHLNDASEAATNGRPILPGQTFPDISNTPRYLFTGSGTATVRITAYDYR